jgi:tRNA pseudouridine38-40 synthase
VERGRGVQTILLTIGYHGAAYAGWQRQDGFPTVQEHVEDALATIFGERIVVHGAGRTDAGVHALRQAAHVRLPRSFAAAALVKALNGNLPLDIAVTAAVEVPARFHARFSATGKRYVYRFLNTPWRPVHGLGLFHWVRWPMDLGRMRAAAAHIVGEHDFAAFASNPGYPRTRGTVRRITQARLVQRPHGVDFMVEGNGFLYNQVRALAGTLQQVATGRVPPERMREILLSRDRSQAGMTAPACGLYLVRVLYAREVLGMGG